MYSFPQQQKIFKEILTTNPLNKQCADCNTVGPTCAHRAMGPTITRVKSSKLDQWEKAWMERMKIGNKELNQYWEANLGMNKKPRTGVSQQQLLKYATEKYVKKTFVKDKSEEDPLTKYRNGTYTKNTNSQQQELSSSTQQKNTVSQSNKKLGSNRFKIEQQSDTGSQKLQSNKAVELQKKNLNLLQFDIPSASEKHETQSEFGEYMTSSNTQGNGFNRQQNNLDEIHSQQPYNGSHHQVPHSGHNDNDDDFTEFTEHGTSFTGTTNDDKNITYEDLLMQKNSQNSNNNDYSQNIMMGMGAPGGIATTHNVNHMNNVYHNHLSSHHNHQGAMIVPGQLNHAHSASSLYINNHHSNSHTGGQNGGFGYGQHQHQQQYDLYSPTKLPHHQQQIFNSSGSDGMNAQGQLNVPSYLASGNYSHGQSQGYGSSSSSTGGIDLKITMETTESKKQSKEKESGDNWLDSWK